ncbi:restriction endonuclease [Streptomyces sp. DSM 42041]|uniref:Restriction endonuclease n=1 Tax=Streptomyces hazeniae TaxID=3075538 RepID=A0ABU2NWQ0_9ACTN|nr:restriction endonuclease [Streptomyces sp. DSM 42041]MDT0381416.1 restriction endonuclease [Streptomyces sp. DSM 42041]
MTTPHRIMQRNPLRSCTGLLVVAVLAGMLLLFLIERHPGLLAALLLPIAAVMGLVGTWRQRRREGRLRATRSTEVARYHAMDPREFEHAVAYLCARDGCRDVRVVGGAGDLGADVTAVAPDGRRIVIQCKRYGSTKVGSPDVQRFGGTCYSVHRAALAAVVTTSVFTRPAAQYAAAHGIACVDQAALAGWASRTGPPPWMR